MLCYTQDDANTEGMQNKSNFKTFLCIKTYSVYDVCVYIVGCYVSNNCNYKIILNILIFAKTT